MHLSKKPFSGSGWQSKTDDRINLQTKSGSSHAEVTAEQRQGAGVCVHTAFEEQAMQTPQAIAVAHRDKQLTYAELNRGANHVANCLLQAGLQPEQTVGIFMERSIAAIAAITGILKAGGVYVPLDPGYPQNRLRYMMNDARISIIVTQEELRRQLPSGCEKIICLDSPWQPGGKDAESPKVEVYPENLAYVIYTSGSTGEPKGVAIPHHGIIRLVKNTDYVNFRQDEVVLQASPITFDASTFEIWWALLNGAKLALLPVEKPSLHDLATTMARHCVTTAWLTSGLFNQMVDFHLDSLQSLHQLLAGGDVLSASHVGMFMKNFRGCRLINGYGPTENTTFTCCYPVDATWDDRQAVPIGRPISGTYVKVLDDEMNPAGPGMIGELWAGGEGLARGYLNRPDLTAERFVPDPFSHAPGARLYKTGDLARYRTDGVIEFQGRRDNQVKVRGFRIELGEIESVLARHPEVRETTVVVREDRPGDRRLIAYVVPQLTGALNGGDLQNYLRSRLPEYMVPGVSFLQEMPLSANGKIDRKALPAPELAHEVESGLPANNTQEIVASLWTEALGLTRTGLHQTFCELGGDSLLAMKLIARLRSTFNIEISLPRLLAGATVAKLSSMIEQERHQSTGIQPRLQRATCRENSAELSYGQQRLWFQQQLDPHSNPFIITARIRLKGTLNREAISCAIDELVHRHEPLRTHFPLENGTLIQRVQMPVSGIMHFTDLHHSDPADCEQQIARLLLEESSNGFDLHTGPVFRAQLLHIDEEDHLLLLSMHHIVTDGWSMNIVFRELFAIYSALINNQAPQLPELPCRFIDYAVFEREFLKGSAHEAHLDYWKGKLKELAVINLPSDRPRPPAKTYRGAHEPVLFSPALMGQLRELARRNNATIFMTLLATFFVVLAHWSRQHDIPVGSPVAGRNWPEIEGLIGFFSRTLVFRGDLLGDPSFQQLLKQVRQTVLEGFNHDDLPFEQIVQELGAVRDLSRLPLFDVVLALLNTTKNTFHLPDLTFDTSLVNHPIAKFDLALMLEDDGTGIHGTLEYSTDLFDAPTARRMLDHLVRVMEQVVQDPGQRIHEITLLSPSEYFQVVEELNQTTESYPQLCVHELFSRQAQSTPHSVAVAYLHFELTYEELDCRANQLANYLIHLGVGPEDCVALYLNRSTEMVVSLMGILKAGAAYLPIDPSHPRDRVTLMLEEARPEVLITEQTLANAPEKTRVLLLDSEWPRITAFGAHRPVARMEPANLAYVIYTSGSTGRPKGIQIEHRSLSNCLSAMKASPGLASSDVLLAITTLSFDIAALEIFLPLIAGARLVIATREEAADALLLGDLMERHAVTVLQATPATWRMLLDSGWTGNLKLKALIGGEAMPQELMLTLLPKCQSLWNMYGPTETTIWSSTWQATADKGTPVLIGSPISNTRMYILDDRMRPVPIGIPGHLWIAGDGLMRGYFRRPELTALSMGPDAFSSDPGRRMYRTGDLVRWHGSEGLAYLGRTDDQVKIRGFRIECGEIEAVLRGHPQVQDAAVIVKTINNFQHLIAYFVAKPGPPPPESSDLKQFLQQKLPDYMLPSAFVPLEELPLTVSRKINRTALAHKPVALLSGRTYVAPQHDVERILARCWGEILKISKVGIHDNFFDLGGHSLLSMQLVNKMILAGFRCTIRDLHENPTIESLVKNISVSSASCEPASERGSDSFPLLPTQLGLMEMAVMQHNPFRKLVPFFLKVADGVDEPSLVQALDLWHRQEIFRLRFRKEKNEWRQFYDHPSECPITKWDIHEEEDIISAAVRVSLALLPAINVLNGPPLQIGLLRSNGVVRHMIWLIDHLLFDPVSFGILLTNFQIAYKQVTGNVVQAIPRDVTLQQWANYLWHSAQTETFVGECNFWKTQFKPQSENLPKPSDRFEAVHLANGLSRHESDRVFAFMLQHRISFEDLCLTALLGTYKAVFGENELLLCIVNSGRQRKVKGADVSQALGWFSVYYPARFSLEFPGDRLATIRNVLQQRERFEKHPESYGALRYYNDACRAQLEATENWRPAIEFNSLGELTPPAGADDIVVMAPEWIMVNASFARQVKQKYENPENFADCGNSPYRKITFAVSEGQIRIFAAFYKNWVDQAAMENFLEGLKQSFFALQLEQPAGAQFSMVGN